MTKMKATAMTTTDKIIGSKSRRVQSGIKMAVVLYIAFVLLMSPVFANSGPVIMEGHPGSEMIVDENSQIEVMHESLSFDVQEGDYRVDSLVEADYQMHNTATESQTVKMAFPLVSDIMTLQEKVKVEVNGNVIPFEVTYLDQFDSSVDMPSFKTMLQEREAEITVPINLEMKQYTFKIPEDIEKCNLEIRFDKTNLNARVFVSEINSYGYMDGLFTVGKSYFGEDRREMKLILESGELKDIQIFCKDENGVDYKDKVIVEEKTITSEAFYESVAKDLSEFANLDTFTDQKASFLEKAFNEMRAYEGRSLVVLDDISSYLTSPRIILLTYEVPFASNEEKSVKVTYSLRGTFDRSKSSRPTFEFDYFLSPASYWKDFESLTITVKTPKDKPYVIESSLPLEEKALEVSDGLGKVYTAEFSGLPKEDFTFMVYEKPSITAMDKAKGRWSRYYSYLFVFFVLPISVVILSAVAVIVLIKFLLKHKKNK